MRLYFATHDGQTRLIADRLSERLAGLGIDMTPTDLAQGLPSLADLNGTDVVVLVAPVRYGHHLPVARKMLDLCKSLPNSVALAVASVNLTARKDGKNTAQGNPYLRKWLERAGVEPALSAAFAGRLDYPRYGWLDKQMIRLIMAITKGPTDPSSCVEYTDWEKVDAFADAIAGLAKR